MAEYYTEGEFCFIGPSIMSDDIPHRSVRIRKDADINSYKERIDDCIKNRPYVIEEAKEIDDGPDYKRYWVKLT